LKRGQLAESAALVELGNGDAVQSILKRMEQMPGAGKTTYIDILSRSKSRLAIPALIPLLKDRDPWVVASAADALGKLNARDTIEQLRPLVDENQPGPVRWAAARALSNMGDAGGGLFLRQQLSFPQSMLVQVQAAEALAPLGPNADWMDVVRRHLSNANPETRLAAARVIAPYDQAAAQSVLESLGADANPAIREEASSTLANRVANDFATLRRLLRSPDASTAVAASARILELTR
jgi:HEAT repeat protein